MLFVCGRISTEQMSCARSAFWKTVFFWMPSNDPRRNESVICWKNVPSFVHVRMHTERARGEKIAEQFHRFHTFPLFIFMIFISISLLFCIKASQKKPREPSLDYVFVIAIPFAMIRKWWSENRSLGCWCWWAIRVTIVSTCVPCSLFVTSTSLNVEFGIQNRSQLNSSIKY